MQMLTWVTTEAVRQRKLGAVQVVGCLRDVGEVCTATKFKKAWNGFLRLYNLMQFLPDCLFVTAQGLQDNAYQSLEFVFAAHTALSQPDDAGLQLSEYAGLVDSDVLDAMRALVSHGVHIPAADAVPYELCGLRGNIMGQAELAWEEPHIAFVYEDDTESKRTFERAGWTVYTVEALIARPAEFTIALKGSNAS
jgi:DEAD/DEAH box helicase domain-containing protein